MVTPMVNEVHRGNTNSVLSVANTQSTAPLGVAPALLQTGAKAASNGVQRFSRTRSRPGDWWRM
jgi:hypothetical protein